MADSERPPSPPTWAILNGTSRTGVHLAELALARGSAVHVLVRSATRLPPHLTAKPAPAGLHVHELADLFDPAALAPIIAQADVVALVFAPPAAAVLRPTTLNTDAAVAAVAAIRAGTPPPPPAGRSGRPRTRVLLLSSLGLHPGVSPLLRRLTAAVIPEQARDLERARRYLQAQAVWGLEHAVVFAGKIVEATPGESVEQRLAGAVLSARPVDLRGYDITYGRLAGTFVQAAQEWERWKDGALVPVPIGEPVSVRAADKYADLWPALGAHSKRLLRGFVWAGTWLAVGWLARGPFGDLGLQAAWMRGARMMGWR